MLRIQGGEEEEHHGDSGIEGVEYHSHYPYSPNQLKPGDEIRIALQHQDLFTYPSQSFLCLEGRFLKEDGSGKPTTSIISNNAFAYLFDEIRYELCGSEIDRVRNPGITSTMKGYASFSKSTLHEIQSFGWSDKKNNENLISREGYFAVCLPLSSLLGIFEDYQKVIMNVKQELILLRARRDENCFTSTNTGTATTPVAEKAKIELSAISWRVPYLSLSSTHRLQLHRLLQKEKNIKMNYRSWEMYEYPLLPTSEKQLWNVKTSSSLEKPRFVMLAFQTGRKFSLLKNASHFDHCKLSNVKLYLNSKCYPYDDLNLNFDRNQYSLLYRMYSHFQNSYYGSESQHSKNNVCPLLSFLEFREIGPIVILDCSRQSQSIKAGPIDVMLEFESKEAFPADTTAYCLIIHDRSVEYNPLTNIIRRMVV